MFVLTRRAHIQWNLDFLEVSFKHCNVEAISVETVGRNGVIQIFNEYLVSNV
jgi:hypothetical protein